MGRETSAPLFSHNDIVKMLAKCVLVVLLSLASMLSGKWIYLHRNPKRDFLRKHITELTSLKEAPKIIFMGDSHFVTNLLKDDLPDSVANISFWGESPLFMLIKLNYLLDKGLLPKILVLEADPQLVTKELPFTDAWRYRALTPLDSVMKYYEASRFEWIQKWLVAAFPTSSANTRQIMLKAILNDLEVKFILRNRELINGKDVKFEAMLKDNWMRKSEMEKQTMVNNRLRIHYESRTEALKPSIKMIQQIANLCAQHSIRLVLLRSPISVEYRRQANVYLPAGFDADFPKVNQHGLIDARSLFDSSPNLFSDQDHLNRKGAKVFAQWVLNRQELSLN
jgi:hypothetical protein